MDRVHDEPGPGQAVPDLLLAAEDEPGRAEELVAVGELVVVGERDDGTGTPAAPDQIAGPTGHSSPAVQYRWPTTTPSCRNTSVAPVGVMPSNRSQPVADLDEVGVWPLAITLTF